MQRRRLGASGLVVPRVALGCGNFGGVGSEPRLVGEGLSESEAFVVMDAAWKLGITHFDTADAYGAGRSEEIVGRWIASRGEHPLVTTKTFFSTPGEPSEGLAPARVQRQLAASLRRLGVEQVDLYLAHWFDPDAPLASTLEAFSRARGAGLVRAYGVSNFDGAQVREALAGGGDVCAVQNGYSLLQRGDHVLGLCIENSVAYLAHSPLRGGWLTGKYRCGEPPPAGSRVARWPEMYGEFATSDTFTALDLFGEFASACDRSMAELALAWVLGDERVTQVVVGASEPAHLRAVAGALAKPLSAGERDRVLALFERAR
jgi:aryl-alcohol dehydrogenase-like predicted oxidoreductase